MAKCAYEVLRSMFFQLPLLLLLLSDSWSLIVEHVYVLIEFVAICLPVFGLCGDFGAEKYGLCLLLLLI